MCQWKDLEEKALKRCVFQKIERQQKKPSNTWYKKQEKNEEKEVQNTLTQKSGGKSCTGKCQQFQEYE